MSISGDFFRRGAESRGSEAIFEQKSSLARFGLFFSLPRDLAKKNQSFGLDHGRAFFKKWLHRVVLRGSESRGTKKVDPGSQNPKKVTFFAFFRVFLGSGEKVDFLGKLRFSGSGQDLGLRGQIWQDSGVWHGSGWILGSEVWIWLVLRVLALSLIHI